jgi:hypothetical protein
MKALIVLTGDLFCNIALVLLLNCDDGASHPRCAGPFPTPACRVIDVSGEALSLLEFVVEDGDGNVARAALGAPSSDDGTLVVAASMPNGALDRMQIRVLADEIALHVFLREAAGEWDLQRLVEEPMVLELRADEGETQLLLLELSNHWETRLSLGPPAHVAP